MSNKAALEFIGRHEVIILDLCQTFMFDCDRFSDPGSLATTYRRLGGSQMSDTQVHQTLNRALSMLEAAADDPEYLENFPQVRMVLYELAEKFRFSIDEVELLEEVFALHEVGTISDDYTAVIHRLGKNHRLGLLSNIWSSKDKYMKELHRSGVAGFFENIVFSSDHGMVKPSTGLFDLAIRPFGVDRTKIVYIGDSFERDVVGAKTSGLASIWLSHGRKRPGSITYEPDLEISDLLQAISP